MATFKYKDPETGKWSVVSGIPGPAGSTPVKGVDYFTEEDKAEIATAIIEAGGQPDWSQNDPEARDYVKNRFGGYYETAYENVFEETECAFEEGWGSYEGYMAAQIGNSYNFTSSLWGERTVRFIFDGVSYERTYDNAYGFEPDKNTPFGFSVDVLDSFGVVYTNDLETVHTIAIDKVVKTPVIISEEFLPDTVKAQPDWSQNDPEARDYVKNRTHSAQLKEEIVRSTYTDGTEIIFEHLELTFSYGSIFTPTTKRPIVSPKFVVGDEYRIIWDAEEYSCAFSESYILGGFENGYPFRINDGSSVGTLHINAFDADGKYETGETSHTISIYHIFEEVLTLEEKYLSESVKAVSDWNQNEETGSGYIKNRPGAYMGTSLVEITPEVTLTGTVEYTKDFGTFVCFTNYADHNIEKDDCVYHVYLDGTEYVATGKEIYSTRIEYNQNFPPEGLELPLCIYLWWNPGDGIQYPRLRVFSETGELTHTFRVEKEMPTPVPLDEKFLPETVATKEYVSNGITIRHFRYTTPISSCKKVLYGNGMFVLFSGSPTYAYSTDGRSWTKNTIPLTRVGTIAFCNDRFIATYYSPNYQTKIAYSFDGISWVEGDTTTAYHVERPILLYGNNKYIIFSGKKYALYSNDGTAWSSASITDNLLQNYPSCGAFGNGIFVVLPAYAVDYPENSKTYAYSSDGVVWTSAELPNGRNWKSIVYADDKFVVASADGYVVISADGLTWEEHSMSPITSVSSMCYCGDRFVASTAYSNVTYMAHSFDGITWTKEEVMRDAQPWLSIAYGGGRFVMTHYSYIATGTDIMHVETGYDRLYTVEDADVTEYVKETVDTAGRFDTSLGNEYMWGKFGEKQVNIIVESVDTTNAYIPYSYPSEVYEVASVVDGVIVLSDSKPVNGNQAAGYYAYYNGNAYRLVEYRSATDGVNALYSAHMLTVGQETQTGLIGYVNSPDPNAYPIDDGYSYTILGQLGAVLSGGVKIATGSYTGTGSTNEVVVGFTPKLFMVQRAALDDTNVRIIRCTALLGQTVALSESITNATTSTYGGKGLVNLTWGDTMTIGNGSALNAADYVYEWIALG